MKPILKEITLTNGRPLESFVFSGNRFNNTIQLLIGPHAGPGEELFDFTVRNFDFDEALVCNGSYLWIEKDLAMELYNPEIVKQAVNELLSTIEKSNWSQVVDALRAHMRWEFD
jgi:hypothetical protein